MTKKKLKYEPIYFLSSLGSGGLAVSFYMYFMFMVKHKNTPMATFDQIFPLLSGPNKLIAVSVILVAAAILFFALKHFMLLFVNFKHYVEFKRDERFSNLKKSNGEVALMTIPLTLTMSINVVFILAVVFVPKLWSYIEYLFPFSLLAFALVGLYAVKLYAEYFSRIISDGDFDFANNNNLSQVIASFTFAMLAVGFAAPAAMSHHMTIVTIAFLLAMLSAITSIFLMTIKMVLGFKSMLKKGISFDAAPSIWMFIPIATLLGITFVRLTSSISHNFMHSEPPALLMFIVLSAFVSLQLLVGYLGYLVLRRISYFEKIFTGEKRSIGAYSLICPGVAFFVLGMFFVHWGLVKTNILPQFSPAYFAVLVPFVLIQFKTIRALFKLDRVVTV
ncbi:MAG: hypothetical protein HY779_04810 [Rubrobacteridae bacterium]|nr:hypothetical protein [Rubrobacteridae bacterium]